MAKFRKRSRDLIFGDQKDLVSKQAGRDGGHDSEAAVHQPEELVLRRQWYDALDRHDGVMLARDAVSMLSE